MSKDSQIRDYVVFLAAFETVLDKIIEQGELEHNDIKGAKTARTYSKRIMRKYIERLPDDKKRAVWHYANNVELKAIPSLSPEAKRNYCIVENEALYDLAETACEFCLKTDKEAKRCKTRKKLERCGIFGTIEGTACPFKLI